MNMQKLKFCGVSKQWCLEKVTVEGLGGNNKA